MQETQKPVGVVVIAGTSSGVGKTTLSVGVMAALRCAAMPYPLRAWDGNIGEEHMLIYELRASFLWLCFISNPLSVAGEGVSRCRPSKLAQVCGAP